MRPAVLPMLLLLAACQPGDATPAAPGPSPALLTVFSAAGTEAPPQTGLFERYSMDGPSRAFTVEDLAGLEAHEIITAYPGGTPDRVWRGPRLSDVLRASGAPGTGARITALDGYVVDISAEAVAQMEPILAISVDGNGLALGGLGPIILIWPQSHPGPDSDQASDWIWSAFAIEAIEN